MMIARWLKGARRWLSGILFRGRFERDMDEEIRFHLEMEIRERVRSGMDPLEARRTTLRDFGGVERFKEEGRRARGLAPLDTLVQDLRFGLRGLRRAPGTTAVVVLSLVLGIGAATSIFSLMDGILLRPMAYPDEHRLLFAWEANEQGGIRPVSYPSFRDWEERVHSFAGLAYARGDEFRARGEQGTERLLAAYVSGNFFSTLGTAPLAGRTFGESATGEENVVVLSHTTWMRRYGGNPGAVGQTLSTADGIYTVVGVMPPGFQAPRWADVWLPVQALPPGMRYALDERHLHADAEAYARLAEGVSLERAQEELSRVVADLAAEDPGPVEGSWTGARLTPVRERTLTGAATPLRIMAGAVALLLVLVCVNVANLQIARGAARRRELAVRAVLGADRPRLTRQLMTENLGLALLGGAGGVALAWAAVTFARTRLTGVLPRLDEVGMDLRTLAFALGTTLLSAVVFGLLPARRAASIRLDSRLREGSSGAGQAVGPLRLRQSLVVLQVALALVLTVGAGLLVRSMARVMDVDPGFRPEGVIALRVFPPAEYDDPEAAADLYRRLQEAVARVPSVESVALANHLPMAGGYMPTRVQTSGPAPATGDLALYRATSPGYLDVMGVELVEGRPLNEEDLTGPGAGVLVNRAFVKAFLPDRSPIGEGVTVHRVAQGRPGYGAPMTGHVVGVVEDERFLGLEADVPPAVFVPYTWSVWPNIFVAVRTTGDPARATAALREAVRRVDADIPVAGPSPQAEWRPMDRVVGSSLDQRRLQTGLLASFAVSAVALAVLGILGVTGYMVTCRRREMGLRMALGASRERVAASVLAHALKLTGAGLVLGAAGAWAGAHFLESQLFGVSPLDPVVLVGAALLFVAAATAAAALPTARAMAIAPGRALRQE